MSIGRCITKEQRRDLLDRQCSLNKVTYATNLQIKLLNLKILPNLCHRSEFTDRVVSCNLNLRLTVKLS